MLRTLVFILATASIPFCSLGFSQRPATPQAAGHAHAHNHGAHGPNGGELLEIGQDEYHAEFVIDEVKKQIVVYLLDKDVKTYVAIDAPSLAVNLKIAGKPAQVKLLPVPQESDRQGLASRFGAANATLVDALHDPKADPKLSLRIGKKSYVAKLVHNHDHAGHDHAGHDHTGHAPVSAPKKR